MLDLNNLAQICLANAERRQKNGANITTETRKMLKHCATEVVEATEAYTEWNEGEDREREFSSELSDIICCCLIIAGKENIDIEEAILNCIKKNRKRADKKGDKL